MSERHSKECEFFDVCLHAESGIECHAHPAQRKPEEALRVTRDALGDIQVVYEKFKHLDHLLADREWGGKDLRLSILHDLWEVISGIAQSQIKKERRVKMLEPVEFRYLLDLFMVSDPWPLEDGTRECQSYKVVEGLLNEQARGRGYPDGWMVAYHEFNLVVRFRNS